MKNKKVPLGYSDDLTYNSDWQKQKRICGYQHCIERMPVVVLEGEGCPVFGHECPGGDRVSKKCREKITSNEEGENNHGKKAA